MHSAENPRGANHRALSRSSYEEVDEAIERGSPAACLSALLVAIAIFLTLSSGDFVSENAAAAWQAIEHDTHVLAHEIGISSAHASP